MKTTIFYLRQLLVLFAVMLAFSACDDDKDDATGGDITIITPSNNAITCGGTVKDPFTISFTATSDWTARPSHGWLSLSKMTGGAGDHTIILMVADNDNFDKSRVGTITITDKVSKKSVDILVTQGAKNAELTFSSKSQEGMELEIISDLKEPANNRIEGSVDVASNYDYEIKLDKEWLGYQTSRNDDGSTNINFKVTDYDKLYNDGGYGESTCTVSFVYASQTRAANTVTYKVKFPGITPYLEFYVSNEEEAEAVSSIELEEGDYIYSVTVKDETGKDKNVLESKHTYLKSAVYIKSNIQWQQNESDKLKFDYNSSGNLSAAFFESNTSIKLVLNELDTEGFTESMKFKDVVSNREVSALDIVFPGTGNSYVYIDRSAFPVDSDYGYYMFDSEGTPEGKEVHFTVNAANPDDVAFVMAKMQVVNGAPTVVMREIVNEGWKAWGGIDPIRTRSAIQSNKYSIWMKERNSAQEYEGGEGEAAFEDRYFALFAVSKEKYADEYGDVDAWLLFDDGGNLLPELEDKYIVLGQKKKVIDVSSFSCPELASKTISVPAKGGVRKFDYTGLAIDDASIGGTIYYGVEIQGEQAIINPEKYGFGELLTYDSQWVTNSFAPDPIEGVITLVIPENKTGKPRSETYALTAGSLNDAVLLYFTIEQAAE